MSDTRPLQLTPPTSGVSPRSPDQRALQTETIARFRQALSEPSSALPEPTNSAASEGRDAGSLATGVPAMAGSLYYSLPLTQTAAPPGMAPDLEEAVRLIEQATSVAMERAARADASRFIVSLDHAIVGGASAEFIRDGAFLHVRLLARNDAAYRSMWTHRAELEERLGASTGLVARVEIIEGYGDGRSA